MFVASSPFPEPQLVGAPHFDVRHGQKRSKFIYLESRVHAGQSMSDIDPPLKSLDAFALLVEDKSEAR